MPLTFKDSSLTPHGGWTWKHPETGFELRGSSFGVLLDNIRRYCQANNLPIGSNMEQDVIDSICVRVPKQCREAPTLTLAQLMHSFAGSMTAWLKQGAPVLTWDAMMERRKICTGDAEAGTNACPEWRGDAGFQMGRCGKCGCLAVKMFLATEKCPLDKWAPVTEPSKLHRL